MQYYPYDGYEKFEEISIAVKTSCLEKKDPMSEADINGALASKFKSLSDTQIIQIIDKAKALLDEKIAEADKSLVSNQTFKMPNMSKQVAMLEWAGINFGS